MWKDVVYIKCMNGHTKYIIVDIIAGLLLYINDNEFSRSTMT